MALNFDPYDATINLQRCSCGGHASQQEHDATLPPATISFDDLNRRALEAAAMRALFPRDVERRRFLQAVGAPTAMTAIANLFPFGAGGHGEAKASLEKKELKVGFVAITCATPLIMAGPHGHV